MRGNPAGRNAKKKDGSAAPARPGRPPTARAVAVVRRMASRRGAQPR
ncbi:hypothetical protein C7S16_2771 [Burkholderia thailandensis]|uniref:Uncharacterized protein n=1 Tax=Burkholderia thailandensis TaxID=57975 RepID=A0AAW9D5Q4_BURTH|nr:hypothetical protein [Burkholderia thailandensis]